MSRIVDKVFEELRQAWQDVETFKARMVESDRRVQEVLHDRESGRLLNELAWWKKKAAELEAKLAELTPNHPIGKAQ